MKRTHLYILAALVMLVGAVVLVIHSKSNEQSTAQEIPANVYYADMKRLSAGTKPACLTETAGIMDEIKQSPQPKNEMATFDLILGSQIVDMPAGYTTVHAHSYDGKTATGSMIYSDPNQKEFVKGLDRVNFAAQRNQSSNEWTVISFIACHD
jgi:hypothetical protein